MCSLLLLTIWRLPRQTLPWNNLPFFAYVMVPFWNASPFFIAWLTLTVLWKSAESLRQWSSRGYGDTGKMFPAPGCPPSLGSLPSVPLTAVPFSGSLCGPGVGVGGWSLPSPWDWARGRVLAPSLLGLQGKANLLVEPGGLHVLHVVVLDLAEEPDPFLRPLDVQWGCRESWGWGGRREGWVHCRQTLYCLSH